MKQPITPYPHKLEHGDLVFVPDFGWGFFDDQEPKLSAIRATGLVTIVHEDKDVWWFGHMDSVRVVGIA